MKTLKTIADIVLLSFLIANLFMVFIALLQSNQTLLDGLNNALGYSGERQISLPFNDYIKNKIQFYYTLIFPILIPVIGFLDYLCSEEVEENGNNN